MTESIQGAQANPMRLPALRGFNLCFGFCFTYYTEQIGVAQAAAAAGICVISRRIQAVQNHNEPKPVRDLRGNLTAVLFTSPMPSLVK